MNEACSREVAGALVGRHSVRINTEALLSEQLKMRVLVKDDLSHQAGGFPLPMCYCRGIGTHPSRSS